MRVWVAIEVCWKLILIPRIVLYLLHMRTIKTFRFVLINTIILIPCVLCGFRPTPMRAFVSQILLHASLDKDFHDMLFNVFMNCKWICRFPGFSVRLELLWKTFVNV